MRCETCVILIVAGALGLLLAAAGWAFGENEATFNKAFCAKVGGQTEVRREYRYKGGRAEIVIDCLTDDTVYEGGLDTYSSLDSLQQAMFAAFVTGKRPAVVIYDTDNAIGPYEHRIFVACGMARVQFIHVRKRPPAEA